MFVSVTSFSDIIKNSIIQKFRVEEMDVGVIGAALVFSLILSFYLFFLYRFWKRKNLYNINMNISIVGMTLLTTAIMLTIQSNLVLSLGMVGALSIVRYRTAVKDPMDLFFLFWAIADGIMCGAQQYLLAIIVTVCLTCVVFLLSYMPVRKAPYVMVVNCSNLELEDEIINSLENGCRYYKVKSRIVSREGLRMVIELRTQKEKLILGAISSLDGIDKVSLLTYEGDVVC